MFFCPENIYFHCLVSLAPTPFPLSILRMPPPIWAALLPLIIITLVAAAPPPGPEAMAAAQHPHVHPLNAAWTISGAGRTVTADLPVYALEALVADGQVPDPLHG